MQRHGDPIRALDESPTMSTSFHLPIGPKTFHADRQKSRNTQRRDISRIQDGAASFARMIIISATYTESASPAGFQTTVRTKLTEYGVPEAVPREGPVFDSSYGPTLGRRYSAFCNLFLAQSSSLVSELRLTSPHLPHFTVAPYYKH